jgi:hypothetical protein
VARLAKAATPTANVSRWPGNMDLQIHAHGQHSRIEGHMVAGAGGQAVPRVQTLGGPAVFPRLDVASQLHPPGAERGRVQAAEDTSAAAVVHHIQREHVLSDAGRGQDDPFGILLKPATPGSAAGNLIPEGVLEYRHAQLLAEEGELAAILEVEEIGRALSIYALGARGTQQQTVNIREPGAVLLEHGPGKDVPFGAVRARAIRLAILASTPEAGR